MYRPLPLPHAPSHPRRGAACPPQRQCWARAALPPHGPQVRRHVVRIALVAAHRRARGIEHHNADRWFAGRGKFGGESLELARKLEVPQLLLVVNKALESFDFNDLSQRIFSTYRTPVAAVLPLSTELIRIGSTGLIRVIHPEHAFAQGVERILDMIED